MILDRVKHALLVLGLSGCVTTAGIVKQQEISLPLLIGATALDLVVTSAAASQIQDYSYGGSLATCLIGACLSPRP